MDGPGNGPLYLPTVPSRRSSVLPRHHHTLPFYRPVSLFVCLFVCFLVCITVYACITCKHGLTLTIARERSSLSLQSDLCSNRLCLKSTAVRLPSPLVASRVRLCSSVARQEMKSLFSLSLNVSLHDLVSQS